MAMLAAAALACASGSLPAASPLIRLLVHLLLHTPRLRDDVVRSELSQDLAKLFLA